MSQVLTKLVKVGQYQYKSTSKVVNIHKGHCEADGKDYFFYLFRYKRMYVDVHDLAHDWRKLSPGKPRVKQPICI